MSKVGPCGSGVEASGLQIIWWHLPLHAVESWRGLTWAGLLLAACNRGARGVGYLLVSSAKVPLTYVPWVSLHMVITVRVMIVNVARQSS